MTATEQYVSVLTSLKVGELGLLREHAGRGLDESVDGFDLFAGLWWPLREKNARAPRRGVAWLVAKLYARCPVEHAVGRSLAGQLARCRQRRELELDRVAARFDQMLTHPIEQIEVSLRWSIELLASQGLALDWVQLTDDLSSWERETIRLRWAEQFLRSSKEDGDAH